MSDEQQTERNARKVRTGVVISEKMDKTVLVAVKQVVRHRTYGKTVRRSSKLAAHDEANDAHVGDTVLIEESRPLSATKRWRLVTVVARAGEHGHGSPSDMVAEEAEVTEAIHAAAHPGRQRDDAAGDTDATAPAADATDEASADAATADAGANDGADDEGGQA